LPAMRCPYSIQAWARQYQPGDFFDVSAHFGLYRAYAELRWIGGDGRYYCDLYLDPDQTERRTGASSFRRSEIEDGFELCGGPTCRAELAA